MLLLNSLLRTVGQRPVHDLVSIKLYPGGQSTPDPQLSQTVVRKFQMGEENQLPGNRGSLGDEAEDTFVRPIMAAASNASNSLWVATNLEGASEMPRRVAK